MTRQHGFYEQVLWYAKPPPEPHPTAFLVYLQLRYRLVTASKKDLELTGPLAKGDLVVRATPIDIRNQMRLRLPVKQLEEAFEGLVNRGWIRRWGDDDDLWILGKEWRPFAVDTLPASDLLPPGPLMETTT